MPIFLDACFSVYPFLCLPVIFTFGSVVGSFTFQNLFTWERIMPITNLQYLQTSGLAYNLLQTVDTLEHVQLI